jgi:hypothetical protein
MLSTSQNLNSSLDIAGDDEKIKKNHLSSNNKDNISSDNNIKPPLDSTFIQKRNYHTSSSSRVGLFFNISLLNNRLFSSTPPYFF